MVFLMHICYNYKGISNLGYILFAHGGLYRLIFKPPEAAGRVYMDKWYNNMEMANFNSKLWEQLRGAYGNVKEDVVPLMVQEPYVPENEKSLYANYKCEYMVAFDNIFHQLSHQLSFYNASYIVLPYLAKAFDYWYEKDDFGMQVLFLMNVGTIVCTDNPSNNPDSARVIKNIPKNLMESYNKSILFFKEKAEEILLNKLELLKPLLRSDDISYTLVSFMAFLGKREYTFVCFLGSFSNCLLFCEKCGFFSEDIELDYDIDGGIEELNSIITPAESVIGKWDKKSLDNTYIWLSNALHLTGCDFDVQKLSYFYGTFTCPKCGAKAKPAIDLYIKALNEC